MKLTPEDIRKLAKTTLESKPEDLDCTEWVHMVGEYVEAKRTGAALNERCVMVSRHVAECASCEEELKTLSALLDGE